MMFLKVKFKFSFCPSLCDKHVLIIGCHSNKTEREKETKNERTRRKKTIENNYR